MDLSPNPYRIPKPRTGVLWKGILQPANEKGRFVPLGIPRYEAVLTATHLWLWEELAIPLITITEIVRLNAGAGLQLHFHQALIGQDLIARLCMLNFLLRHDARRMTEFTDKLCEAWQIARDTAPAGGDIAAVAETMIRQAACEKCGDPQAALLDIGWQLEFGVMPLAGIQKWNPTRPYLCQKHAVMATCRCNFATSILGCFGFPAIITGPYYIWRNAFQLKKTFPVSQAAFFLSVFCGLLIPVTAFSAIWKWLVKVL